MEGLSERRPAQRRHRAKRDNPSRNGMRVRDGDAIMVRNSEPLSGSSADDQRNDKRRLIVPIPKSEPPLEESFIFPADNDGLKRRATKRDKETKDAVPKNKRTSVTII